MKLKKILYLIKISIYLKRFFFKSFTIQGVYYKNLIFSTKNKFFKIKIDKASSLSKEIDNYIYIKNVYIEKNINSILPVFESGRNFLITEKLEKINKNEYFDAFQNVFLVFSIEDKYIKFCEYNLANINKIIENFNYKIDGNNIKLFNNYLKRNWDSILKVGFCHGDLHTRNILKDKNGNYKIIDLDCFRPVGLRDFEVIYYVVELLWLENSLSWWNNLFELRKNNQFEIYFNYLNLDLDDILPLFLLDRFSQDLKYVKFEEYQIEEIFDAFFKLLSE